MITTVYKLGIPFRIAHVSDLHERDPEAVIEELKKASPDVIFVTGDSFERHHRGPDPRKKSSIYRFLKMVLYFFLGSHDKPDRENGRRFIKGISKIAPVFLSLGNHEWYLEDEDMKLMDECGVTVLDNRYVEYKGIYIGGISSGGDRQWLEEFRRLDGTRYLLAHHPEIYNKYHMSDFDLVFSGHAHGGLIRLFNHAVFAPGQGFFPEKVHGVFGNHIINAGCSNTTSIPRIGNPTEIVIIE